MTQGVAFAARRLVVSLITLVALGALVVVALGFLGRVHGLFDSLSHFRAHFAAVAVVAGLLAAAAGVGGERLLGALAAAAGIAGLVTVAGYVLPKAAAPVAGNAPTYRLLQMNVLFRADLGPALERIAEIAPDVVTLQEVRPQMLPQLAALADYPHRAVCEGKMRARGEVILSRHPLAGKPACLRRMTMQAVDLDGTPVTVVSQHLSWPWPHRQAADIGELAPTLAALSGPVIVAGDFNAAPWSRAVRTYAALSGTTPVAGIGFTWPNGFGLPKALTAWVGLPIDNVLTSPQVEVISARRAAPTRSDHLPVVVEFAIDPRAQDATRSVASAAPRAAAE